MLDYGSYSPRFTRVRAIQITEENFHSIAATYNLNAYSSDIPSDRFFLTVIQQPGGEGPVHHMVARIGDWIVEEGLRIRVYKKTEFGHNFIPTEKANEFQLLYDPAVHARNIEIRKIFESVTDDTILVDECMARIVKVL